MALADVSLHSIRNLLPLFQTHRSTGNLRPKQSSGQVCRTRCRTSTGVRLLTIETAWPFRIVPDTAPLLSIPPPSLRPTCTTSRAVVAPGRV
eukprot:364615-Chlamydomonas_euryale.AAC.58